MALTDGKLIRVNGAPAGGVQEMADATISAPLSVTAGTLSMSYTSGEFTTAGGMFALKATGITAGAFGGTVGSNSVLRGLTTDSKGRISAVVVGTESGGGGSVETGAMLFWPDSEAPTGYLEANGAEVSQTTYSDLYAVVGSKFNYTRNIYTNAQPWRQQYQFNVASNPTVSWTTGTSLPGELGASQAIVTSNRVYLLGGYTGSTFVSTVYTAPINADGTLGTWTTGTSLPGALSTSQAIVTSNRVYLLGGYNGSAYVSTVYTAPINADGTLGTWTTGTSLPGALGESQAIVTSSRVYLMSGNNGSTHISTVYTAPINEDGTLGTWTTGTSLPGVLSLSQAIVTSSRVYLLGGYNGSTTVSTVYTAPINADGTLGTWTTGTSLPGALGFSQAIVTSNRVYLMGGNNGSAYVSTVYTAPINADGTLGTWTTGTSLPGELGYSQAIVTSSRVYLMGGDNGSAVVSTVYVSNFAGGRNDYMNPAASYLPGTPSSGNFFLPNVQADLLNNFTDGDRHYIYPIIKT